MYDISSSISPECKHVISLMMFLPTPAQRRAMKPETRRDRVETSLDLNPREVPRNLVAVFNILEMLVGVTSLNCP